MELNVIFLVALLASASTAVATSRIPGSDIVPSVSYTLLKQGPYGSKLFTINCPGSDYETSPPYLLDLRGNSSYEQGFDAGYLVGQATIDNYDNLMVSLLGDEWWEPLVAGVLNQFLFEQWTDYLSVQVPDEYKQEIDGMTAGGHKAGLMRDVGKLAAMGITLANLPGSLENIKFIFEDEKQNPASYSTEALLRAFKTIVSRWKSFSCSMFGVWGSRTATGNLFSGRNLDWLRDTGISEYKLITIHRPTGKNRHAHAVVGWAGIWGAITGMSSQGITVHEANLESNDITFRGFPWVLRLRHVMAVASNLQEGIAVFNATNSTVGFNHAIGSAADKELNVLETMKGSQAVFSANDPRELYLEVEGYGNIGAPRSESVYRTNHGYDQYTIEHYMWNNTNAYRYSIERYMLFPQLLDEYSSEGIQIDVAQAVNITAVVGDKGETSLYSCDGTDGANILSVTFDPSNLIMYVAWENGTGDMWMAAACNSYLKIDLNEIF